MAVAVDYSFARPSITELKAAGVTVVIRYLTGGGKSIMTTELASYLAAGISVVVVFEIQANDALGGHAAGVANAQVALSALKALGLVGCPVYFAVDSSIMALTALPYFEGIATVMQPSQVGVYGEGALCSLLQAEGLACWYWQSSSTSFPGNSTTLAITHIQQKVGGSPLAGTDLDILCKPDVGQWPRPVPLPPVPPPVPGPIYPEDDMQSFTTTVQIVNGEGWCPIPGGKTAAQVVSVTPVDLDPAVTGHYANTPQFAGVTSDNKLVFGKDGTSGPTGNFGFIVWTV